MGSKKILLINSHVKTSNIVNDSMVSELREEPYPSTGLLYLASTLKKNNYDVSYLDIPAILKKQNLNFQNDIDGFVEQIIAQAYDDYKPDFAGIGCLFSGKFPGTLFIASTLKRIDRCLPVGIGGIHPTVFHKEILERFDYIDFIIMGEGEAAFTQLLNSIFFAQGPLSKIDGLCYRNGNKVSVNPKSCFISDLDTLPFPSWELLRLEDYEIEPEKWEQYWHNPKGYKLKYRWPFLSSRSCPLGCNFCAMHLIHGRKIRSRSVENCAEEIGWLYNEYGINYFSIIDDNFTIDKRRVMDIADKIRKDNLKIYIDTPNGISINSFDKDTLDALKAMGLLRISLAVESGSEYIRNRVIGKNLSRERIFSAFELLRKEKDIFVRAFFIIGMPQETLDTLDETYNMIKNIYADNVSIHIACPMPGTKLYEEVVKNKLLLHEQDVLCAENFHQASDVPWIKPYNLDIDELIEFRKKVEDLIAQRYAKLDIARKFPIHHLL